MTYEEKELIKLIKAYGYKVSNDNMGMYFTGNNNKFSFIKTGDIYNCYHNKNINGSYQLQDVLQSQILLGVCLRWVFNKLSKKEDISQDNSQDTSQNAQQQEIQNAMTQEPIDTEQNTISNNAENNMQGSW